MPQGFGVYIHIPYCLQRCTYCDFATYVQTEIKPPEYYVSLVKKEILAKKSLFAHQIDRGLDTIYFGGGTPSLIPANLIVELIHELAKFGYQTRPDAEVTIEINPATINEKKLEAYLEAGINRFSVGAQSFSDRLLKMVHREHNAAQTLETLELLKKYNLNYSFDLLFALPTQTLSELRHDVAVAIQLGSKHISPYCLTVPEGHPLSKNRPLDEEQLEMFALIHQELERNAFHRYEISNYSLKDFESRHNLLYWTDQEYWGLGLSAHSYAKNTAWGSRFWNVNSFKGFDEQVSAGQKLPDQQTERLEKHQSLTDFCYTSLRLSRGLSVDSLVKKFGPSTLGLISKIADPIIKQNLLSFSDGHYSLTSNGVVLSNQIFEKFVFSDTDI